MVVELATRMPGAVTAPPETYRPDPADRDDLSRLATGDPAALEALFARHWEAVARAAWRVAGDEARARDAAQEAFIRLHRRPPEPGVPVRAWLCRVALNVAINERRAERRRATREAKANGPTGDPDATGIAEANARAERDLVREALASLPERSREVLVLRAEGFRYAEIAEATGVSPGSVGTLLVRAERSFREAYEARRGGA